MSPSKVSRRIVLEPSESTLMRMLAGYRTGMKDTTR